MESTAIVLVKQDSVFLPGMTISATHWIAYAMTKGRVHIILRSSSDRTLLQLPMVFAPAILVINMAVYSNRLAGVTSDGSFVVWELPEFSAPKPTIHFVILSVDADLTGDKAHTACIAAKLPPGDLALIMFSMHSTGVNQDLIRKEWYDTAVLNTPAKLPPYMPAAPMEAKGTRHMPPAPMSISGPGPAPVTQLSASIISPARTRTPPEDLEADIACDKVHVRDQEVGEQAVNAEQQVEEYPWLPLTTLLLTITLLCTTTSTVIY
ncbi:uncharacterized protein BJ212DRAFT_1483149 [Suillus subaureus]|uniref:Uncharacterized protein n=1 Tax=Suillus subaureus TaxID=48587 RepID=A0A9P7E6A2_9AGAM|nr:uncharacterized protein BJ212DRAFT_1483149 [Suillus subaureus]KAG1812538.1 hypothetical protein BJ212DRAFT_1483149 [Suillus subaureus]